ncbi:hypothetical protein M5033_10410, partial [Neisseria meningitidis]|nr:hypothetical protein [Neisseria meningitidis]
KDAGKKDFSPAHKREDLSPAPFGREGGGVEPQTQTPSHKKKKKKKRCGGGGRAKTTPGRYLGPGVGKAVGKNIKKGAAFPKIPPPPPPAVNQVDELAAVQIFFCHGYFLRKIII